MSFKFGENFIALVGLNHKTSSVEEREEALKFFRELPGILLATCNRVEVYLQNTRLEIPRPEFKFQNFYYFEGEKVIKHLFRVASGLDSQILGETEILGQVRKTYLESQGKYWLLDRIFGRAVEVGKRVRKETAISQGNVSVASVAVAKAVKLLGGVYNRKVILIGVGKVSETVAKILWKLNFNLIYVANRTYTKALELAQKIGGNAVHFDQLAEELKDADLVISSTAAPHLVLRKQQIGLREKPLIIFDLAVPRDVDPEVSRLPGILLFNIDDLQEEINLNLLKRKLEAVFAEKIIEEEVKRFCESFALAPAAAA